MNLHFHRTIGRSSLLVCLLLGTIHGCSAQDLSPILTKTFVNPAPATNALFGSSVAGMGSDRILVGAEGAAKAFLLDSDGKLLTTYHNPAADFASFGAAVAVVGGDRVLVGSYGHYKGELNQGRAYLFTKEGDLLSVIENPLPGIVQAFGWAVAPLGAEAFVVGGGPDPNARQMGSVCKS